MGRAHLSPRMWGLPVLLLEKPAMAHQWSTWALPWFGNMDSIPLHQFSEVPAYRVGSLTGTRIFCAQVTHGDKVIRNRVPSGQSSVFHPPQPLATTESTDPCQFLHDFAVVSAEVSNSLALWFHTPSTMPFSMSESIASEKTKSRLNGGSAL